MRFHLFLNCEGEEHMCYCILHHLIVRHPCSKFILMQSMVILDWQIHFTFGTDFGRVCGMNREILETAKIFLSGYTRSASQEIYSVQPDVTVGTSWHLQCNKLRLLARGFWFTSVVMRVEELVWVTNFVLIIYKMLDVILLKRMKSLVCLLIQESMGLVRRYLLSIKKKIWCTYELFLHHAVNCM